MTPSDPNNATSAVSTPSDEEPVTANDLLKHPGLARLLNKILKQQPSDALAFAIANNALNQREIELILRIHAIHTQYLDILKLHKSLQEQSERLRILLLSLAFTCKREQIDDNHPLLDYYNTLLRDIATWYPTNNDRKKDLPRERFEKHIADLEEIKQANSHEIAKTLATLQTELTTAIKKEQSRTHKLEARLIETENGQRAINNVEKTITQLINNHISGNPLPENIYRFVYQDLRGELQYILINNGRADKQFRLWEKIIKILGWLFQPEKTKEQKRQLTSVVPDLIEALNQASAPTTCTDDSYNDFIETLNASFFRIMQNQVIDCVKTEPIEEVNATPEKIVISRQALENWKDLHQGSWFRFKREDESEYRVKLLYEFEQDKTLLFTNREGQKIFEKQRNDWIFCLASGIAAPIATQTNLKDIYLQSTKKSKELIKKILADTEEVRHQQEDKLRAAALKAKNEAAALKQKEVELKKQAARLRDNVAPELQEQSKQQVAQLKTGDWIDYVSGEEKIRGKLAVHLLSSDKYIFTDRLGNKLLELTTAELIEKVTFKTIFIHGGGTSFEDQLAKVVSTLRKTETHHDQ